MERLRSNADLATILQGITDGVTVQAPDGSLVYANEAAARQSGYRSAQAMLSRPVEKIQRDFELADEEGRPFSHEELPGRQALQSREPAERIVRVRQRSTGEERWSVVQARPIFDEQQRLRFVVNVFRDITALKRAEANQRFLAEAGKLLASSLDYQITLANVAHLAVPEIGDWCAVDLVRDDGSIQNLAMAHVDPSKVQLAHDSQRRYPPDPSDPTGVPNVIRTGQSELYPEITDELLEVGARDAEQLDILRELGLKSAMVVPLTARERTLGAITIISAESGRRYEESDLIFAEALAARAALAIDNARLYQEVQQAVRTRDEFLATASHDLRNPLAAIKGAVQVLQRILSRSGAVDPKRFAAGLATIDRTTNRMAQLIEALLDATRLQMGQPLELERRPTDLATLVSELVAEFQHSTQPHRIMVRGATGLVGQWDTPRLERALGNLLSNAIKYSPEGGEIHVKLERENGAGGAWAVVKVRDSGLGIPAEDLPRIFERFHRGSNVVGRISGVGIGLAGARQIVEQHDGTIAVESQPGLATTFTVRLPLEARPAEEGEKPE